MWLIVHSNAFGQFSPGELSRVHRELEGMNNCLQCHETGKEISGAKCLTCHQEIKSTIDSRRGYHFRVSAQTCVSCHKEHLGRDAQTIRFDKNTFDHSQTGFVRTGKHATTQCGDCHSMKNIRDDRVRRIVTETGRQTYLGLLQSCSSCHDDRHNNTVGKDCQKCHSTKGWSPVTGFDHSQTRFTLAGRHATVVCTKCHTGLESKEKGRPLLFATRSFSDCAPCHSSPHNEKFSAQLCSSCHSPEGWNTAKNSKQFNHDLTSFRLVGRHAGVACEKCHKLGAASTQRRSMKLAHNKCTDCHSDFHRGEFGNGVNSGCEKCHTTFGFSPSTVTIAAHGASRFPLSGAHAATPCERCHVAAADGRKRFHFTNIRCDACHGDKHGGQFSKEMAERSCAACHSTDDWLPNSFDHSKTNFPLVGRHTKTKCESCHKPIRVDGRDVTQYKRTSTKCESCHKEVHMGQFASNNETNCATCHQPHGWKLLVFDHDTQSTFALTGAHKRVECRQCHREERRGASMFVRYKPMSSKCESCHAQGTVGNAR